MDNGSDWIFHPAAPAIREHLKANTLASEPWVLDRLTISPDQCSVAIRFRHPALAGAGKDELVITASRRRQSGRWQTAHTIIRALP